MKILIIEDQENLASLLKRGLEREGHTADYVTDGETGQKRIEIHHRDYDLIILDLMLPKKSGYEICKNIRDLKISIPILVLTARGGLEDKVNLLDLGADDYLTKPFEFDELVARVRALNRRPEQTLPTELKIHELVLKPADKTVFVRDKEIKCTLTEFRLLEYLMRHPNQAVSREDLMTSVWDFNFDSFSNIIDVYINRLRAKIKNGKNKNRIETIRGIGYKLIA